MSQASRTTVLVLFGGRSAEHEISILSARFVIDALDRRRFEPLLVGIDPDGIWHLLDEGQLPSSKDPRAVKIDRSGPRAYLWPMPAGGDRAGLLHVEGRAPVPFDVVFPVLHGPQGEDGCMQGLFELAAVPYVGSGVAGCAVGMDKVMQKQIFHEVELPIVAYHAFDAADWRARQGEMLDACAELGSPVFVKPANMGSSLGVRRAADPRQLRDAIEHALSFDTKVVVEHGLVGAREIECSVLGNHDPRVSLPGEIVVRHGDGFYSYDAKYIDDGADLRVPAELFHAEQSTVQLLALRAYRALDCAGMARVDMFMSAERQIYLNEVNTIPGFTAISMYPSLWRASGLEPAALVSELVELGLERHRERQALRTSWLGSDSSPRAERAQSTG
jgi:D-alanine-D-alanine ligase